MDENTDCEDSSVDISNDILPIDCNDSNDDSDNENNDDSKRLFRCDVCLMKFIKIEKLFSHIDKEHEDIQLTKDLEAAMLKQWKEILNFEKSAMKLILNNKLKSAKKLLKSSIPGFRSIYTSLFTPKDNIFDCFITSMQKRIKSCIKESKRIEIERKKRKRKHVDNEENGNKSDFSSDDDICLKELKDNTINDVTNISEESDECLKEVNYYIVPVRKGGKNLTPSDKKLIYSTIIDAINNKEVNLKIFHNVILKRYDIEDDEIVPEDAFQITGFKTNKENKLWHVKSLQEFLSPTIGKNVRKRKKSANNVNKVKCEICQMSFASLEIKEKHIYTHKSFNKWFCEVCKSKFNDMDSLKNHFKGDSSCKSQLLRKRFSKDLENDEDVPVKLVKYDKQSDEAPECEECHRKFTSFGRLTQHINVVHKGKVFRKNGKKSKNNSQS